MTSVKRKIYLSNFAAAVAAKDSCCQVTTSHRYLIYIECSLGVSSHFGC